MLPLALLVLSVWWGPASAVTTNDTQSSSWESQGRVWFDDQISLGSAWTLTKGPNDLLVGVVDMGVDWHHVNDQSFADLLRKGLGGNYDDDADWDVDSCDADPYDPGLADTTYYFHGTEMLDVIGARTNNSRGV